MIRLVVAFVICLCLASDVDAWTHGRAIQPSGANLISGSGEFLKSGGGDQLVSQ